jgi:hypothetical protein
MIITCPSCSNPIEQNSPPVRGPVSDGSEAWVCLKCPAVICVACYPQHTDKAHPEMYRPKKPTDGGRKKGKKQ